MNEPILDGLTCIERTSIKDLAFEQINRYIFSGVVKPGERLPSERVLSERLGVGRSSVREALKVLEAIGLIESRVGEGTFLNAQNGASIGLSLATWGGAIVEIIGARRIMEVEAARVAAERPSRQISRRSVRNCDAWRRHRMTFPPISPLTCSFTA